MLSVVVAWLMSAMIALGGRPVEPSRTPTFNNDIGRLIFAKCGDCHRDGGGAPFSLTTYEQVRSRAAQIAHVTRTGYMPPWKPRHGFGTFAGERRLTDEEIELIQRWVTASGPEGDGPQPAPPPSISDWQLGMPDLIVKMPEAYPLAAGGADVFRTFVLPIATGAGHYVKGIEIAPGVAAAVHHATLKIDRTRSSRRLDEAEDGPGFAGGGGRTATFPDGHFLTWTPGQTPYMLPAGMSWRLEPDSDLVLELHLMPTGKTEPVQVSVGLFFTDRPPSRHAFMLRLGSQSIDIPAGSPHYTVNDRYVLPVDIEVIAVQPHAHNLAREVRGTAYLPDGSVRPLIWIKDWDFRWQDVYRYREPLRLPQGTTLEMEFRYDNSASNIRNPHRPPKRVTFGQTTASEMGNLYLQVVAASREQLAALESDFAPKMLSGDVAGYEKMIELDPDNAQVRTDLAFLYLAARRMPEAVAQFQEALRLAPHTASAHYALGTVLLGQGRIADARARFNRAIELEPEFGAAHNNLGIVSQAQGQPERAIAHYTEALRLDPADRLARHNRARAHAAIGDSEQAIADYQRVLLAAPDDADARAGLAAVLAMNGHVADAIAHYRHTVALQPSGVAALVDLAWLLATAERLELRSPKEAVDLAQRADRLTDHRDAAVLETLAVAYFAAGQTGRAAATAQKALALAIKNGPPELVDTLKKRVASFEPRGR